jgi:hypothetical protein
MSTCCKFFRLDVVIVFSFILFLTGCGGGSKGTAHLGSTGANSNPSTSSTTSILYGSVGDGPIVGATVKIFDKNGNFIDQQTSDSTANYQISIHTTGNSYPLTLEAFGGQDMVTSGLPDFTLKSILITPGDRKRVNINPFSTLIVATAQKMPGGINSTNIQSAEGTVLKQLNFGLDPSAIPDPITSDINDTNTAVIIRSSEALSEMLRRTRDTLKSTNPNITADQIISYLGADLSDGVLDGKGAAGSDARTAAVSNVASAQVLLETMQGQLNVNNLDASTAMDNAVIISSSGTASGTSVNDLPAGADMITQAATAVHAVQAFDSNPIYATTSDNLATTPVGTKPADITLPADVSTSLSGTLTNLATSSSTSFEQINSVVRDGGQLPVSTNSTPTISGKPATTATEGIAYRFTPSASDPDGDSLSFTVTNLPSWASFNTTSGSIRGTPGSTDVGTTSGIVITVSDGVNTASLPAFSITVNSASTPNTAPTISGTPATSVPAGVAYSFTPSANDANGDSLSFSVTHLPTWAHFNTSNGTISGTPTNTNVGTTSSITITVSDGIDSASLPAFSITVTSVVVPNTPPTISGSPTTSVTAGNAYRFTPTASDADGDTLSFSITNLPSWARFSTTNGTISGTPSGTDVGTTSGITITVSDGTDKSSLPAFSITVASAPNTPPTISGTPATSVTAGNAYSFVPTASDADGDSLTFTVANLPSWAKFNTTNGTISGNPSNTDAGTTSSIKITVSDGIDSVSLPTFSITVNAVVTSFGSATLSWTPPTQNSDGSTLTDLNGYKIYYGTKSGAYTNTITINNPGISSYVVDNLPGGNTYYFVITAMNSNGVESNYSTEGSKAIP